MFASNAMIIFTWLSQRGIMMMEKSAMIATSPPGVSRLLLANGGIYRDGNDGGRQMIPIANVEQPIEW